MCIMCRVWAFFMGVMGMKFSRSVKGMLVVVVEGLGWGLFLFLGIW